MKIGISIFVSLLAITGCSSGNPITEKSETELIEYEQLASKVVAIEHHEVETGTKVALLSYINDKGQLCVQWVAAAKKVNSEIDTTIEAHCGEYEIRNVNSTRIEYVPIDIKAVNDYLNNDGLLIQSIEI